MGVNDYVEEKYITLLSRFWSGVSSRTRPSSADDPSDPAVRAFEDTGTNERASFYNATLITLGRFGFDRNAPAAIPLLQLTMTLLLPPRSP